MDARSDEEQLDEAFEDFDTFLTAIGEAKINAREIGGFPVYLVLTRCDLLAKPGDTPEDWQHTVDAKMEAAQGRLLSFLDDEDPDDGVRSPFLAFGKIDLTVHAVAVRRPLLKGDTLPANEPHMVAELFRAMFVSARRVAAGGSRRS